MPPIRLCESNPHYFEFNGKPVVLITSGEHFGAVINTDFDYVRYLDTLAKAGFNLTRTFAGTYREIPNLFNIVGNTLAPREESFLCPWARSDQQDLQTGGAKFDLSRFDDAYFARLKDFISLAGRSGVVVELALFSYSFYKADLWAINPMNPAYNVNDIGDLADSYSVFNDTGPLLEFQQRLVRKIVAECNEFDNLYYEIMNEPYSRYDGTMYLDWQNRITDVIVETERSLPKQHLIAWNVQNRTGRVREIHPDVSILDFHYADPSAVATNYHLDRAIMDAETGFKGQASCPYRMEAWRFMLAGGAGFSHLDYSFTAEHPDGTAGIELESPSFGGPEWRSELAVLKKFMDTLPIGRMSPCDEIIGILGMSAFGDISACAFGWSGQIYVVYIYSRAPRTRLGLGIPEGRYQIKWIRPIDGQVVREETIEHEGGLAILKTPLFAEDVVLRMDAE